MAGIVRTSSSFSDWGLSSKNTSVSSIHVSTPPLAANGRPANRSRASDETRADHPTPPKVGNSRRIARGVFASVLKHADAATWSVDGFLTASRLRQLTRAPNMLGIRYGRLDGTNLDQKTRGPVTRTPCRPARPTPEHNALLSSTRRREPGTSSRGLLPRWLIGVPVRRFPR